jgi:hypothetical protein
MNGYLSFSLGGGNGSKCLKAVINRYPWDKKFSERRDYRRRRFGVSLPMILA